MTNLSTLNEKINKTLDYCDYVKDLAHSSNCTVYFKVEIENTYGETETEDQHAVRIYRRRIGYTADTRTFFRYIWQAILHAQKHSFIYNCLSSVNVFIETYDKDGAIVDEEPVDEYEINFVKGIEVQ